MRGKGFGRVVCVDTWRASDHGWHIINGVGCGRRSRACILFAGFVPSNIRGIKHVDVNPPWVIFLVYADVCARFKRFVRVLCDNKIYYRTIARI